MTDNKFILDVTCAGKMMWYNKNHPNTIYTDFRREEKGLIKQRPNFEVQPDMIMDLTQKRKAFFECVNCKQGFIADEEDMKL